MKSALIITFLFLITGKSGSAQFYVSPALQLTNDAGTFADKSNVTIEFGKQWDVFSLGLDYGRTSLSRQSGRDTTNYLEIRPNLNIFQQDKFTNTITAGVGYIFGAQQTMMTELTSGVEYAYSTKVHFNMSFGQYYYSGRYASSSSSFFGVSIMYYFIPVKIRGFLNKP